MAKSDNYEDLIAQKAALEAQLAPQMRARHKDLRQKRDAIEAELQPLWDELATRPNGAREDDLRAQIKAIRAPMSDIDKELSDITADLKGKTGEPAAATEAA